MGIDFGKGKGGPSFGGVSFGQSAQFREVDDPLAGVQYSGNLAQDAGAELTAMQAAYRERAKAEASRFRAATDSEYWFAVCFTSREAKEAFLEHFGLMKIGDKYLDGTLVRRALDRRPK